MDHCRSITGGHHLWSHMASVCASVASTGSVSTRHRVLHSTGQCQHSSVGASVSQAAGRRVLLSKLFSISQHQCEAEASINSVGIFWGETANFSRLDYQLTFKHHVLSILNVHILYSTFCTGVKLDRMNFI